jgi:hypothetical protein
MGFGSITVGSSKGDFNGLIAMKHLSQWALKKDSCSGYYPGCR